MNNEKLVIILTNDDNSVYELEFELFDTDIAKKWLQEVREFISNEQQIDDPLRFYNFPNSQYTKQYVVDYLNDLVGIINNYAPGLITKYVDIDMSQDTLNYLHHIFEVYHGLYDEQKNNKFFNDAPDKVKYALRDLNIWIHRFESFGKIPRFVATCYQRGRKPLSDEDFKHFSLTEQWGDLNINYCEVGKTLVNLYQDEDQYIDPQAFKPLHNYSFDFTVRFTDKDVNYYNDLSNNVWEYFDDHSTFFLSQGFEKFDPKLSVGSITVGRLAQKHSKNQTIFQISRHQKIKEIKILD
jgi:hypothetical protein